MKVFEKAIKERNVKFIRKIFGSSIKDKNWLDGWIYFPRKKDFEKKIEKIYEEIKDFDNFVFVGFGGSINGIKIFEKISKKIQIIDSLDPEILKKLVKLNKERTKIIVISKSMKTFETLRLIKTLENFFPKENFIFLTYKQNVKKVENLGYPSKKVFDYRFDESLDFAGRFSYPFSLLFFLPLLIHLWKKERVFKIYENFLKFMNSNLLKVLEIANQISLAIYQNPKFNLLIKNEFNGMEEWIYQIFLESLGSKRKNYEPKIYINKKVFKKTIDFRKFSFSKKFWTDLIVFIYLIEWIIALVGLYKKINFVNQKEVERYKKIVRKVEEKRKIEKLNIQKLKKRIKNKKFLDVIFYGYTSSKKLSKLEKQFEKKLRIPTKVFIGNNWNHFGFQAASKSKETFYLLLVKEKYNLEIPRFKREELAKNVKLMKKIALATRKALKNSLLFKI
ncbi:MAG: hypothetical protein B6U78_00575 [Candidatus Aenigmarchaeota archaeon ex4484_224]|nr:MAG: hypothetical protein B6U78_00575 [Candidatus Aenigmarchaeota archaeon ex4484_224]